MTDSVLFFFKLKCSWFTMLCQSLLYNRVTQLYTYIYSSSFFIHLHYGLSQEIGYSSLCNTVGPRCLSILYIIVCTYQPQTPSPSLSLPPPPWQRQFWSLCLCDSVLIVWKYLIWGRGACLGAYYLQTMVRILLISFSYLIALARLSKNNSTEPKT